MPLTLTLRRSADWSPFRQQLLRLVTLPGGQHVFLCSGFIDAEVFDDELVSTLKEGCSGGKLILLAGILKKTEYKDWPDLYDTTIARLLEAEISVSAYQVPLKNWHAKIALRLRDATPLAAIVGSSNLTNPAVAINPPGNWNYECDVTMWHDPSLTGHFRDNARYKDPYEHAELTLDPAVEDQPGIEKWLKQLWADLNELRKNETLTIRKANNT